MPLCTRLFLCLLLLTATGCFREPTAAARRASLRPLAGTRIADLTLTEHTARRTVYLLATPSGDLISDSPGRLILTNVRAGAREVHLYTGTAVVLTRDGYLMTAAHCADAPNLTVIAASAATMIVARIASPSLSGATNAAVLRRRERPVSFGRCVCGLSRPDGRTKAPRVLRERVGIVALDHRVADDSDRHTAKAQCHEFVVGRIVSHHVALLESDPCARKPRFHLVAG